MKIYKIAQNIEYLEKIGVPPADLQKTLDYLLSLDGDSRKIILRKIRKNPSLPLDKIKEIGTDTKKDYLRKQGYPEEVIDYAVSVSPKYSVWLAREIIAHYKKNFQKELPEHTSVVVQVFKLNMRESLIKEIFDWAKATNPDLLQYSLDRALESSKTWHQELARKAEEEGLKYKTHKVWHTLSNGWEIVELSPGDCEPEGNNMGHCVGGYSRDIAEGRSNIFSLRDPKNEPHVTIETEIYYKDKNQPNPKDAGIAVKQIQGKQNAEPIPEYKAMIKEWFDHLKTIGYEFDPMDDGYGEKVTVRDLGDYNQFDDYGLTTNISGIGGDAETYYQNILDSHSEGDAGSYWYRGVAEKCIDNVINYADQHNELDELEAALTGFETTVTNRKTGKPVKTWKSFSGDVDEWWFDAEPYMQLENPRLDEDDEPDKEDFITPPDPNQLSMEGVEPPQPLFDEDAYNEALEEYREKTEAYEKELEERQNDYEPLFAFVNYVYDEIQKAKKRKKEEKKEVNVEKAAYMNAKITKIAVNENDIPNPDILATYIESLKLFLKDNPSLDKKIAGAIKSLPSPRIVKRDYSEAENKILFETVDWAWRKITGKDIIKEQNVREAPESLRGNYWLLKNGILLHGTNHFSIVKQNTSLISTLLNLNGFALQENLCSRPNNLIKYIIKNGGVRLFVNKNKVLYTQMSSETYGKWGKQKIKKLDFQKRIVKIIDFTAPFEGWKSGIKIKL